MAGLAYLMVSRLLRALGIRLRCAIRIADGWVLEADGRLAMVDDSYTSPEVQA